MLRNFGAPKIEHLGPKHKFSSCYVQKVTEVLVRLSNIILGPME
jgi:hypothetical protein